MTYKETLTKLSETSADSVNAAVVAYTDGVLGYEETVAYIAAIIAQANARAASLADLALAADLTVATGAAVAVVGVGPTPDDTPRLAQAAGTLLDALPDTPDAEARTRRLGRSEPLTTAQQARGQALTKQATVQGWTRNLSADPCELCVWWSRGGRVWPKDHKMPTHKGCTCSQTPVLTVNVKPVSR